MAGSRRRLVDAQIADSLDSFGAVILQGPRAVGKTTTGLRLAASSVRLDESPDTLELARLAPKSLLAGEAPRLIDEWQLAPTLWNAVRHEVDSRAAPGQFILTGSATPADDTTHHSGAGRFRRVTLRPMSLTESGESIGAVSLASLLSADPAAVAGLGGPTVEEYAGLTVRGGWPALVAASRRSPGAYLSAYLDDVARVDLRAADVPVDPVRMAALIRALARNTATERPIVRLAEEAELTSADVSLSAQTARKYLDALTRVFVLEDQPAFRPHLRSAVRVRVAPKWHLIDPSLAAAALEAGPDALLRDLNTFGLLFESLCVRDLRVYAEPLGGRVSHYRDDKGLEVDAIVELRGGAWAAFEVKLGGERHLDAAARHLLALKAKVSPAREEALTSLNILTAGSTSFTRPDGVNVVALGHLAP